MACSDGLQFEELVKVCEEEKRWEFLVVAAPLAARDRFAVPSHRDFLE